MTLVLRLGLDSALLEAVLYDDVLYRAFGLTPVLYPLVV